jgi:2-polyprenyl-3-methyl-5-hydroxy-6-metoxy-1,4-benzoquinol methylase
MQYDPIKQKLGVFFNRNSVLRILFYNLLDLLLLRTWHIQKEIKKWTAGRKKSIGVFYNTHILDAGAGFGQYTYYLSKINSSWNILSIDLKEDQVGDCNNFFRKIKKGSVLFKTGDLTTFTAENTFDLVVCVDVMEHIKEDELVFRNFYNSMKKDGMLLISTPSDQGGSDVHGDGDTSFIEEHVRDGYNIAEIERKLKTAGFNEIEARYSYGAPGKISWRLSMKYPILALGITKLFFLVLPFYYLIIYPICYFLNYLDTSIKWETGTGLIVKAWK